MGDENKMIEDNLESEVVENEIVENKVIESEVVENEIVESEADRAEFSQATGEEVMLFLGDELGSLHNSKKVDVYDLETEYAKTRNNRLWSVWVTLFLTFAVVVLVTVFTIRGVAASNEKVDVNLSSFENLNLQNLFDQVARVQEKYDDATKRRAEIKGNLEARLNRAKMKMDSDLDLLKNTRLSKAALAARRQKIQDTYKAEVSAAHSELDAALASAEAEVAQYDEQLKSYDSENIAMSQKMEQQISSERQIHQLEKQRIVQGYEEKLENARKELEETRQQAFQDRKAATTEITQRYEAEIARYDPVIRDTKTSGLLNDISNIELKKFDAESLIGTESAISENFAYTLREAQVEYDNLDFLYGHSESLPMRNTMRSVVSAERKISSNVVNKIAEAAVGELKEKSQEISELSRQLKAAEEQRDLSAAANLAYIDALDKLPVDEKIVGYVLDPNANYGIYVFIRSKHSMNIKQDGNTRVEILDGKTRLATGAILAVSGNYYISLDNDEDKEKISSGNTFRIVTKK